jgi:hypothetical protein
MYFTRVLQSLPQVGLTRPTDPKILFRHRHHHLTTPPRHARPAIPSETSFPPRPYASQGVYMVRRYRRSVLEIDPLAHPSLFTVKMSTASILLAPDLIPFLLSPLVTISVLPNPEFLTQSYPCGSVFFVITRPACHAARSRNDNWICNRPGYYVERGYIENAIRFLRVRKG